MECTNVICISKVLVGGFLNQWEDENCEICGCKTMDGFVKYCKFVLVPTILKVVPS